MRLRCLAWYAAAAAIALAVGVAGACASEAGANVPRLEGITIDGSPTDWGDGGFRVEVMPNDQGALRPPQDFDAQLRLGWNDEGLLALVTVVDNTPVESPGTETLYMGDSVEFFVSPALSSSSYYQYIIAPGRDPAAPEPRLKLYDNRQDKGEEAAISFAATKTADGYVVEAALPWRNLNLTPQVGMEMAVMVFVNDHGAPGSRFQAILHPRHREGARSYATHPIRLSESAGPPVVMVGGGSFERMRRTRVDVTAPARLAGRTAELRDGDNVLAEAALAIADGRATVQLVGPLPPEEGFRDLHVRVGDSTTAVTMPSLGRERAQAFIGIQLNFRPYLMFSPEFPNCDFDVPSLIEDCVGRYTLKTTFYDADYNVVTRAEKPGRYGAVVKVVPERGRELTLFRTLFRMPESADMGFWGRRSTGLAVQTLPIPWIGPAVAAEQAGAINDVLWGCFLNSTIRDSATAALLAGLYEGEPSGSKATMQDDVLARDRQWWVGLKRKLYHMEEAYPTPFVCPRPIEGAPAPTLREGTPAEAGMSADGVARIEALLREWAADSDEGFQVLLARHGVIVVNGAYGSRMGRPMTLTDKSWMASITKLLSGTLMMMLVDQDLVSLDDPVDKFLPAFRGTEVETPLTIRHLYTHANGMWGHWGDELHDFDQLMGTYYPYLEVGKSFSYNGAGYALGGKVIEIVSGEAVPLFYKRHLLDPLGCDGTDVLGTSGDARGTALDLAKVGQLLLNKGAYDDMRFFSEVTFQQMLPERLTKVLGPDTAEERGIGVHRWGGEPLSEQTIGHGAASWATLRIDPVNDLVVVMARNQAGANFDAYHGRFLDAIVEAIQQ